MKKFIYLSIIFLLVACGGTKAINDGSLAYELKNYQLAKELLVKEIKSSSNIEDKKNKSLELADSYMQTNDAENAVEWYELAIEESQQYDLYFDLAMAQKRSEQFEEAIVSLEKYKEYTFDEYRTTPEISICNKALSLQNEASNILITNLEAINTSSADYAAAIYKKDNLVFSSNRNSATGEIVHPWTGAKNDDLFVSQLKNDNYLSATNFDETINTELTEGIATFSPNFEEMYFTQCSFTEDQNGYCYLMMAEADGNYWYEAEKVTIFSDTVNVAQPFMSQDGRRIYFSSDAPFGFGGRDIYYVQKTDTGWSEPYNAGFAVNTDKDEMFPTLDSQGNLYFASNGRTGYGGLDIYKASPKNNGYDNTEHLPYPINSGADDFSFHFLQDYDKTAPNGILEKAIFTSSRKDGKGSDDIYLYEKQFINYYTLTLSVVEKNYKNPEDSESEVLGLQPLSGANVKLKTIEKTSQGKAKLTFNLEADSDYKIFISKDGYFNQSINVSTKGLSSPEEMYINIDREVELEKIFPEKEIVIPNIYYDLAKANLREESLPVLDTLVSFFEENQDLTIEIGSHTDSRGSDAYNEDLSQRRAQSVVDYFISKGIPTAQLIAKGYGETKLTNRCKNGVNCTEEEHQKNRRTTFRVVSTDGVIDSE